MQLSEVFNRIETSSTAQQLLQSVNGIIEYDELAVIENKYPRFSFKFQPNDIQSLRAKRLLTGNNMLNYENMTINDPLARLLFSILWKNGDLHKIQHIVDGITGETKSESQQNMIFTQFGRYLSSEDEPIVDQHVLRAFACYTRRDQFEYFQGKTVFRNSDRNLLQAYVTWYKEQLNRVPANERTRFGNLLDRILFITGKRIKAGMICS